MAGVKGRSGGARPNSGPKPKLRDIRKTDPVEFLEAVFQDNEVDISVRVKAAIAAAPYRQPKMGEGGKGAAKDKAAQEAGVGKFAPGAPPLRSVK